MPNAPARLCGCGAKVTGRCPTCAKSREQRRGSAHSRGYGSSSGSAWQVFRQAFVSMLVASDIVPACGAALPNGPLTNDSRCKADGFQTFTSTDGSSLHFDHEPPLRDYERTDTAKVCDPLRIQLLCASCHAAKGDGSSWVGRAAS